MCYIRKFYAKIGFIIVTIRIINVKVQFKNHTSMAIQIQAIACPLYRLATVTPFETIMNFSWQSSFLNERLRSDEYLRSYARLFKTHVFGFLFTARIRLHVKEMVKSWSVIKVPRKVWHTLVNFLCGHQTNGLALIPC